MTIAREVQSCSKSGYTQSESAGSPRTNLLQLDTIEQIFRIIHDLIVEHQRVSIELCYRRYTKILRKLCGQLCTLSARLRSSAIAIGHIH